MKRNFGFPNATSGTALVRQPRSHSQASAIHTRADNVIQLADHLRTSQDDRLNSERLTAAPLFIQQDPIDHREFGSWFFSVFVIAAPTICVGAAVLFHALFIA